MSSSANSTGGFPTSAPTTPLPSGTNLSSALGIPHSTKYQAGGIKVQIPSLVVAPPMANLTAQEMRDEAMDLRLRANMDFEKVMDTAGEAVVTKEGIRKFLHAWDIYSKNTGIVKSIFNDSVRNHWPYSQKSTKTPHLQQRIAHCFECFLTANTATTKLYQSKSLTRFVRLKCHVKISQWP